MRALALALPLLGAMSLGFGMCGSGDSDTEGPPLPESSPMSEDLRARLHEIRDGVAEFRGLDVDPDVIEGTLTRDQLRAYYDDVEASLTVEDREEIESSNATLRLLRMIGPEDDILEVTSTFDEEGILGFFSYEDRELVFIGDPSEMTHEDEFVLAHEYVHSFQDLAYDFEKYDDLIEDEDDDLDARSEFYVTASCLYEGDASLAAYLYMENKYPFGWDDDSDDGEEESKGSAPDTPPAIERYRMFDYNECVRFAAALYFEKGRSFSTIDNAYLGVPQTTEQILHPEKYLKREKPTGMDRIDLTDRLPDDWELWDAAIFGEFDVYNYLATILEDEETAGAAAAGWGAGWGTVYRGPATDGPPRDVLIHIALEFDTVEDFDEFGRVYGRVLERIAPGALRVGEGLRPVCWDLSGEFGYFSFGDEKKYFDIVIATSAEAREAATKDQLSSDVTASCPPAG